MTLNEFRAVVENATRGYYGRPILLNNGQMAVYQGLIERYMAGESCSGGWYTYITNKMFEMGVCDLHARQLGSVYDLVALDAQNGVLTADDAIAYIASELDIAERR